MALDRELEAVALAANAPEAAGAETVDPGSIGHPLNMMETLGLRTGELHAALAIDTDDPAFTVEPVTAEDLEAWVTDAEEQSTAAFDGLARARTSATGDAGRSEEHTSELQSLMRISNAVFCLKKKKNTKHQPS